MLPFWAKFDFSLSSRGYFLSVFFIPWPKFSPLAPLPFFHTHSLPVYEASKRFTAFFSVNKLVFKEELICCFPAKPLSAERRYKPTPLLTHEYCSEKNWTLGPPTIAGTLPTAVNPHSGDPRIRMHGHQKQYRDAARMPPKAGTPATEGKRCQQQQGRQQQQGASNCKNNSNSRRASSSCFVAEIHEKFVNITKKLVKINIKKPLVR